METKINPGSVFDNVSSAYDKMRPGYVNELYQKIYDYIRIDENSRVVEVGSGSGQATGPFLETGCRLTAVECGENFSEILAEKFKDCRNLTVVTGKFEEIEFEDDSYDLIFAATAFHWVPEEIGYRKVFSMLRPGGAFARFRNHPFPCKNDPDLSREIQALYDRYYYRFHNKERRPVVEYSEAQAEEIAMIAGKYGFTDIQYELFFRERIFTAKEYTQLLGTYSDHIAIDKEIRDIFFEKIEDAIDCHGGTLTVSDTIDLQLARKPRGAS